jgi:hypothetical protein
MPADRDRRPAPIDLALTRERPLTRTAAHTAAGPADRTPDPPATSRPNPGRRGDQEVHQMNVAAAGSAPAPVRLAPAPQARAAAPADADGDHDGSRAAAPSAQGAVVTNGKVDTYA